MKIFVNPTWLKENFKEFIDDHHIRGCDIVITVLVKDFAVERDDNDDI